MKNSTKLLSLIVMLLSTMMILSAENWMSAWMGIEINMLSFITFIEEKMSTKSSESKMMYFLIQSMTSMTMLFTIIMTPMIMTNEMSMNLMNSTIMNMSMAMKMGMAPMHMWFVNITKKMNWESCLMLMTWQKMGPMFLMSNMNQNQKTTEILIMMSAVIGAIGGINQTNIKKIMAFSSINHMSWMVLSMKYNNETWIKYLIIYSMMMFMIILMMKKNSISFMNQMNMNIKNNMEKMMMMMMFMSLGGLPPFIGFLPKWMVISSTIKTTSIITMMVVIMSSMITLFYYMRIMSPTMMKYNLTTKWNMLKKTSNNTTMIMTINLMLPMLIMMFKMI